MKIELFNVFLFCVKGTWKGNVSITLLLVFKSFLYLITRKSSKFPCNSEILYRQLLQTNRLSSNFSCSFVPFLSWRTVEHIQDLAKEDVASLLEHFVVAVSLLWFWIYTLTITGTNNQCLYPLISFSPLCPPTIKYHSVAGKTPQITPVAQEWVREIIKGKLIAQIRKLFSSKLLYKFIYLTVFNFRKIEIFTWKMHLLDIWMFIKYKALSNFLYLSLSAFRFVIVFSTMKN